MAGIDDVLERLITEPEFKQRLIADPQAALADYELTADDLSLLSAQVSPDAGGQEGVERRTSKAGFFGLFAQFTEVFQGGGGDPEPGGDDGHGHTVDAPESKPGGHGKGSEVSIQDVNDRPEDQSVDDPDIRPQNRGIGGPDTKPGGHGRKRSGGRQGGRSSARTAVDRGLR